MLSVEISISRPLSLQLSRMCLDQTAKLWYHLQEELPNTRLCPNTAPSAAVPRQPNLTSLKLAAQNCDLCSAIWKDCSRQRASSELSDTALKQGLSTEQIYIGALVWDTTVGAVPNVVVHQRSSSSVASRSRWLACFEVCADYSSSSASFD